MKLTNLERLNELFAKVAEPDDELYGQHVSQEYLDELTMPTAESIASVKKFINNSFGIELHEPAHGFFTIQAPVIRIENAFRCDLQVFFTFISAVDL